MSNLIPFDSSSSKLPAHLKVFAADGGNEFGFGGGPSYPVISIKGKVFTINRNGEKTLLTKPGSEDGEPASSIEVVILNQGPKLGYTKTFYAEGYVEGSNAKPTCFSNDGVGPDASAQEKQASKCALCQQNAKGSGPTQQNPKAKACKSSKLLAVAPAGQLGDPMLLRVPGGSLSNLNAYGELLGNRKVKAASVVTRIGFNYAVAHQELTFKALSYVSEDMAAEIIKQRDSELVKAIIGEKSLSAVPDDGEEFEQPAPQVAAPKVVEARKPKATITPAEDDDLPTTKKATVAVEEEPKPEKKAAPKPVEVVDGGIDAALEDFFAAIGSLAASPADTSLRRVAIEAGNTLIALGPARDLDRLSEMLLH